MKEKIYFISEKLLRQESLLQDNVDSAYLNNAILTAQNVGLQEVIGTSLYDSLREQVKAGEFKSDEYETLLSEYIQPYLVNRVMTDICVPLHYKFKNAGIAIANDQHFQTANLNELEYVKEHYEHLAVFNANRIIEFVLRNRSVFTEINTCEHWIKLSKNTSKSQIYFRK